jgi:hypothetical protein
VNKGGSSLKSDEEKLKSSDILLGAYPAGDKLERDLLQSPLLDRFNSVPAADANEPGGTAICLEIKRIHSGNRLLPDSFVLQVFCTGSSRTLLPVGRGLLVDRIAPDDL